ncbi:hypothetical protein WSS15_15460 [Acetobacter pasteurianus]|uniref:hypothetical protein n=1 Tax=Acetobacter pasteurianus TaxID=438 RepID=UPI0022C4DB3A|nr:hypothetical protein [Acetobacter pasteurianus]GLH28896.1 hypothetical protein WSS15_15460 [Acetobacter pasteurianus]
MILNRRTALALSLVIASALTGCSEEQGSGADQEIFIHTSPEGGHCLLGNKRGSWEVYQAPEHINITRSREALEIKCANYHGWSGEAKIPSHPSAGGVADAVGSLQIDAVDSVFMEYPKSIVITMRPPVYDTSGGNDSGGITLDSLMNLQKRKENERLADRPATPVQKEEPKVQKKSRSHSLSKAKSSKHCEPSNLPPGMIPAKQD